MKMLRYILCLALLALKGISLISSFFAAPFLILSRLVEALIKYANLEELAKEASLPIFLIKALKERRAQSQKTKGKLHFQINLISFGGRPTSEIIRYLSAK